MTDPGQSTPWAQIPIPSEGKEPDVPVDLASVADPIDTLLKNVIGGATAPTGPLSPNLIEASASIGSLNDTQSAQQADITALQGQVASLSVAPWAVRSTRTTAFTVSGGTGGYTYTAHSVQVPSSTVKRLMIAHTSVTMRWSDGTTTAVLMGSLQTRPDGQAHYIDRARSLQAGVYQTLSCWHMETVPAGVGLRVGLGVSVVGAASSSKTAEPAYMWPSVYVITLPWSNGNDVPSVGPLG